MTERICENISRAAEIIKAGDLVAVPTETVYGLAGNGLDEDTVERIYQVKGRPAVKPLSLMVPDSEAMGAYCEEVPPAAYQLAARFWPGPLTIVLKARKDLVPAIVRAGGDTVGLRCPDHPMTLALLKQTGVPLAAPSANPSTMPSPKDAQQVLSYFDGEIEAVIDGGTCGIGQESTIIDMSQTPYQILRQGALSRQEIVDALLEQIKLIGITGPTGCGKTTALRLLSDFGALVLDCDHIYHQLLRQEPLLLDALAQRFPGTISSGVLDRKALAAIVFQDKQSLRDLNDITHAFISREVQRRLESWAMQGGSLAALDAIELIGSGMAERCDFVLGILSDPETRAARIVSRDNISREEAWNRVRAQKPDDYFLENCDRVLYNDNGLEHFRDCVLNLLMEVL